MWMKLGKLFRRSSMNALMSQLWAVILPLIIAFFTSLFGG